MTTINWAEVLSALLDKFPDQFGKYCEIKSSKISGEGVHAKNSLDEGLPAGINLGITHIYVGTEDVPEALLNQGFTPAKYGPSELRNNWLRSAFGHKLNAPGAPSDINAKSLHFDRNGNRIIDSIRIGKPEFGDVKVLFVLKTIRSELLAAYTIGYNPAVSTAA